MKNKYFLLFAFLLGAFSCTQDFEEINTNPNAPESVNPQFLLTNVLRNAANNNAFDAWEAGNFLGQLTARFDFNNIDRHDIRSNQELWDKTYALLNDIRILKDLGEEQNQAYTGAAMVMQAFLAATLTDLWTDVPYSEALQGETSNNFTPTYDSQRDIYLGENGILQTLRDAVQILERNKGGIVIQGDILYNGDLDQWIRFANSLRLRYLLRISNQEDVASEMQDIVNGGMLIEANAQNALIPYLPSAPNQWFVHTIREGDYGNVRMSTTIEEVLKNYNDPRMELWFRTTASEDPLYGGIPNGLGSESRNDYDLAQASLLGGIFRDQPDGVDGIFILHSEVQFALAEAALKGMIDGNPQAFYEAGIRANLEYYGLEVPADYLTQESVQYNEANALEQIITQKWLASMLVGYEGWLNYRRTGIPNLKPVIDSQNEGLIPVRYRYPTSEQAFNKASYDAAVAKIGGDTYNQKGWWEE